MALGGRGNRMGAHRWTLSRKLGRELGPDEEARHDCDNPICVNPGHLQPGTHLDNVDDMFARGRFVAWQSLKTHCKRGHEFAGRNLVIDHKGKRQCRTCRNDSAREAARRKARERDRLRALASWPPNFLHPGALWSRGAATSTPREGAVYQPSSRPSVSVLVPYRGDGDWRDRVWAWLHQRWLETGWEVITGACPSGPWVKGVAVQDAASRASGDVLIVADADVTGDGVGEAVDAVISGARWAVPHTEVHRLSRTATSAVIAGGPLSGQLEQRAYKGVAGGGVVVLSRDALAECPMDPRFAGWGQEDQAWGLALATLYGEPHRSTEPLWHLWHEPQDRLSRSTGSMGGRLLLRRYQAAMGDREQMRALLREEGELDTREPQMYVYQNKNSGDRHEFPERHARLDRLNNWQLISQPKEPDPRPEVEPFPVADATDPAAPVDPKRPAVNEPKARWLAYAQTRGVRGAETMPKTALIRACG